ncbi:MAG: transposase [bacterium]
MVTPDGFAIPVLTEFVENESQDLDRQDCELKAFYRLAQRLKGHFPRTKFCLLFDSLYAGKPVFDLVEKNGWIYIIRFKEGSMPSVYKEFQNLLQLSPENKGTHQVNANTSQDFHWVNDIEYEGHKLHILECQETTSGKKGEEKTFFTWICKTKITKTNYKHLANQGGRSRWKIENQGFKAQKKEGFELEHAYSQNYNAIKCFHLLLQIAHTIRQLMIKGNGLKNIVKVFGSFKNFTRGLLFAFTRQLIEVDNILKNLSQPYQIRLDSS